MITTQNYNSPCFSGRTWLRAALLCLTLACLCATLSAQTTGAGTITGTISDPTGGVVPGAAVTVKNTATGTEQPLATNAAGIYVAQFLQPGAYDITVTKQGFAKTVRTGLTVQVGQVVTVNFALTVQTTSEAVTVSGDASLVDTEKTEMSQVVSQTEKENLPIAGRRWEGFALLTPNVTTDGGTGLVSYRGISGLYNQSSVDGTNNSQAFFSETKGRTTLFYVYSMDSIQEFQVASSNYSAELGQAAGGVVNAVTKSGTSAIHGDLFYYLRYPTWNALDPLQKSRGIYTQPIHQQQQFGGSVGGPLIKDKLFYFLTYDGSRKVNPISYTSTSFTGPQTCIIPGLAAATQTALTSACGSASNYITSQLGAFARNISQDLVFGKLDYQVNSTNRLSASVDGLDYLGPNSYSTATTVSNSSLSQNGNAVTRERIVVANWDWVIKPTMTNNFRFQWSRDLEIISGNGTAPSVGITNYFGYGLPNALPRPAFPDEHRLQFADVVSITHGKHTFKTGFDLNRIHELLINLFQGGGVYTYSGANNFSNWVADATGINLGDNLTGRHFTTFVQVTDPVTGVGKDDFYDTDFAGFFEDSWKVRPNLTLNLGVRYDLQHVPQPTMPNTSTPLTTLYTSTINTDKNNFAPRFGLAWNFAKGTVLRVGYGIFYAKTTNSTYYATRVENGVIQQTFNCNVTTCPALKFPNVIFTPPGGAPAAPFPGALVPLVVPFTPPAGTQTARGQVPDFVNPLSHEGEVTVEHQLPGNMSILASYVVGRTLRLPMFYDSNIAPSTTTRSYDVTNAAGVTQSSFTVPFYTTRLNPTTGPVLTGVSDVNAWYNSLVITLRRRMSAGLEVVANYTLSKAIDGGQVPGQFGTFNGTDSPIDPYNRKLEYALSDLDQRQRFVGSVVWIPPYAKNISNKGLKMLLDGYTLASIVTVSTGQPVTGVISGNVSGAIAGGPTGGAVNNSGTATGGRSPALPRNSYLGPGLGDVDFRISRDFRFTERVKLSLLGEAFNMFNFTNFFTVNTTQYTYTAAGSGACGGHTNGCLIPQATFLTPSATNNNLIGARQLQISGRITF
jgi:outer membrane receptor protein involved in Fe transport